MLHVLCSKPCQLEHSYFHSCSRLIESAPRDSDKIGNNFSDQKSTNDKFWKGCREKRPLLHCWWECKMVQPLWRTVWRFLKKLKIELPYDPAIPLLGIHMEKTIILKDACTPMFIAALFTIARTWKQPKCPATEEWMKKMWYIYTMEYYSAIKKNKIMPFTATWMDLEIVILSEISQTEKDKYHIILLTCGI